MCDELKKKSKRSFSEYWLNDERIKCWRNVQRKIGMYVGGGRTRLYAHLINERQNPSVATALTHIQFGELNVQTLVNGKVNSITLKDVLLVSGLHTM